MSDYKWDLLSSPTDPDAPVIRGMLTNERYISISDNYFDYVSKTAGVYFYKIFAGDILSAVLHAEASEGVLSVMIAVMPECRRRGIGKRVISDLVRHLGDYGCERAEAWIETENTASIALFRSCGFRHEKDEDELEFWTYYKQQQTGG